MLFLKIPKNACDGVVEMLYDGVEPGPLGPTEAPVARSQVVIRRVR
jgi:hypothetical protein